MAAATAPPTDAAPTPAPPEPKPKASKKVVQGRFGPRERRDLHPMARDDWWHGPAKVFALGLLLVALQKAGCLQIPKRQRAQRVVHFPGSVAAPAPTVLLAADVARCKGSAEPGSGGGPSELTGEGQQGCLLLSIMGEIYDVESGRRHYGARGTYRHFAGRDASRAFVTGKFDEAGLVSSLAGLSGSEVSGVVGWRDFFREHETYKRVGVLAGVFYDADGSPTKAQVKNIYRIPAVLSKPLPFTLKHSAAGRWTRRTLRGSTRRRLSARSARRRAATRSGRRRTRT